MFAPRTFPSPDADAITRDAGSVSHWTMVSMVRLDKLQDLLKRIRRMSHSACSSAMRSNWILSS